MIFRVTFKTPDAYVEAAREAARRAASDTGWPEGSAEFALAYEENLSLAVKAAKRFLKFNECVVVEFNTAGGTARVVPQGG
jgi:hypothetical protein